MLLNSDPETVVSKDDELILIGTAQAEKNFMDHYPTE